MCTDQDFKKNNIRITLSGDLSLYRAGELKARFLNALSEGAGRYELDLNGVTSVDFAVLQLVCAFRSALASLNRSLTIRNVPAAHPFVKTAEELGIVFRQDASGGEGSK